MAVAPSAPQLQRGVFKAGNVRVAKVPLVFSGNYSTGGDTVDLRTMVKATRVASLLSVYINGQAGFDYEFIPGTDLSNGKVKIYQNAAGAGAFAEVGAGAYPAGITGDTVYAMISYLPL